MGEEKKGRKKGLQNKRKERRKGGGGGGRGEDRMKGKRKKTELGTSI